MKNSFVKGAMILGVAGIIIKILGAAFRIPLGNLIGDEGMGYYQTAYPIYVLFLTLATAGIPIAISKMVSERIAIEDYHKAHQVFKVSFLLLVVTGLCSFSICYFGADYISDNIVKNQYAKWSIIAIAPALLLVPIQAAYRGYFQGMQEMRPTAISQSVEQLFRVIAGLLLAYHMIRFGKQYAAAGAAFGATAGAIGGLTGIVIIYFKSRKNIKKRIKKQEETREIYDEKKLTIIKKILMIAIPITMGAAIMPIMNAIDLGIIIRRLVETGWSQNQANMLYGQLTGFAGPLINFPQVLTQALAMSLVPAIAMAYKRKDYVFLKENVDLGVRVAVIIGMPCAFGLIFLARPILTLLYPYQTKSIDGTVPCLIIMGFGVIFLSLVQTLTGILQGIGKQTIPVYNLLVGGIAKITVTYILTGIVFINVKGGAIGTVTAYLIASILNFRAVKKYIDIKINIELLFLKPFISALTMGITAYLCHKFIYFELITVLEKSEYTSNALATIISFFVAILTYSIMVILTETIKIDEIRRMPKGDKIANIIEKIKK